MPKGLKDLLDNIESSENLTSGLKAEVDKLKTVVGRQKRIISEQESIIEEQKKKLSKMIDIPDDILELREIIGTQRQQLNEKELELEYAKGEVAQAKKEVELMQKQFGPTQKKLEENYEAMGNLRSELAEKSSQLMMKNEEIRELNNKVQDLQVFTEKFKTEQVKLIAQLESKRQVESKDLSEEVSKREEKYMLEIQELNMKIGKLEAEILDHKLISTEKDSKAKDAVERLDKMKKHYDDLIQKVGELNDKNREANKKIEELTNKLKGIEEFEKENIDKIEYFDKLKPLMEKEPLFKAFLIIEKVGSITLDDLRNALGSPIILVKKFITQFENIGLTQTDASGKISVKKE